MIIDFKKLHPNAILPKYAKPGDAAMDLTCTSIEDEDHGLITYNLGLAVEIPDGHVGLLFPRSSVYKTDLIMSNAVGVIDSKFRGELAVKFYGYDFNVGEDNHTGYKVGDRVCQLVIIPYPSIEPQWADELSETVRGVGGFGSTGN